MAGSHGETMEKYYLAKSLEECSDVLDFVLEVAEDLEDVNAPKESHIENKQSVYWNFFGGHAVEAYEELKNLDLESDEYIQNEVERFEAIIQEAADYSTLSDIPSSDNQIVKEYRRMSSGQKLF